MTKQTPPSDGRAADGRGRRRALSHEEAQLWHSITRSVRPIGPKRDLAAKPAKPAVPGTSSAHPTMTAKVDGNHASAAARPSGPAASPATKRSNGASPALADFDTRAARRLANGQHEIEARLDLHGMRQSEAHAALRRFLYDCQARGLRYVKVITGKGSPTADAPGYGHGHTGADGTERGVLRRAVPQWLAEAEFRSLVVSHTSAGRGHGGEGALYVQIRRAGRVIPNR